MIQPSELFQQLDKSKSKIIKLRDAQSELLDVYVNECGDKKRIGLRLPTGAGKSLIAILILECMRRDGKKVAILCANNGLVYDMKNKMDELKIETAIILGGSRLSPQELIKRQQNVLKYTLSQSIAIFNYHSFLYGYGSKFSFPLPDILVIDDASDFEIDRNEFGSIRIERKNSDHKNCYDAVLHKLLEYGNLYPNIINFVNNTSEHHIVELVLFPHHDEIVQILNNYRSQLNQDSTFSYSYRRNSKYLYSSLILISQYDIEIRPFIFHEEITPLHKIPQIIFMSATLPAVDLLHKIFGIDYETIYMLDETKLKKETYESIETMGSRLIFPISQEYEYKGLSLAALESLKKLYETYNKLLIMVNSKKESRQITNYLGLQSIPFKIYQNTNDGTDFAKKQKVGCLICVNRFFGLDFPGDTCKIGIIVKLPLIWDSMDRFQVSILNNNDYKEERLGVRITQALGRCNRSEDDESIYYIFDSSILSKIVDPNYHRYYPPNIFSELMSGFMIGEGNIEKSIEYGKTKFFNTDKSEYKEMLKINKQIYNPSDEKDIYYDYNKEINAWKLFTRNSYHEASIEFFTLAEEIEKHMTNENKGTLELISAFNYYLASLNHYHSYTIHGHMESRESYKIALKKAIELGRTSSWFNKLSYIYNIQEERPEHKIIIDDNRIKLLEVKEQIAYEVDQYIEKHTNKKHNWSEVLLKEMTTLNEGTHGQMLNSLEIFFQLFGFKSRRGNNRIGEPDLILLSMNTEPKYQIGIEVKTSEENGEEGVRSLGEIFVDIGSLQKDRPHYITIPAIITQRESFSDKTKLSSYGRSKLISTKILSSLVRKLYEKMVKYDELPKSNKIYYRENLISPIELYPLFDPLKSNILTIDDVEKI